MKILCIYPRLNYPTTARASEPLGILYIASALREEDHEVSYVDLEFANSINIIKNRINDSDIVAISFSTALFENAKVVCQYVKKADKNKICIAGGPHPTIRVYEVLKAGFDVVFIGESERSIVQFMDFLERGINFKKIKGIAFKDDNGNIIINERMPFINDLDSIKFPARNLLNYSEYKDVLGMTRAGIISSRGCPYNCLFCKPIIDNIFGKCTIPRKRSPSNVANEVKEILHQWDGPIFFKDDTFSLNGIEWFFELGQILSSKKIVVPGGFHCHTRVDTIDKKLLLAMKAAQVSLIGFGVESGSQQVLDFYRKGIKISQIEQAFQWCHELEIKCVANIIIGAPMETSSDLEETCNLIRRIKPDRVSLYFLTAIPGKEIYDYAQKKKILKTNLSSIDFDAPHNIRENLHKTMEILLNDNEILYYREEINKIVANA